jgi:two-component system, sensor histidine kinase and response regulator
MASDGAARILIVDDDPGMRLLLQAMVQALGYGAAVAGDGEEALRLAAREPPDAVLLDICMPGLDGREVCRRLRADGRTATVPIVLVTSNSELADRLAGFEAGADDYLCKPFEPQELAARLRAHLELAGLRSQLAQLQGVFATIRTIAHDFNNPLQVVVGGLDMLRMAQEDEAVDESEALGMLCDGTERLAALSSRLVTITEPAFRNSPIGTMIDIEASR